jgi:copper homeostasis protein (lipoprotein)
MFSRIGRLAACAAVAAALAACAEQQGAAPADVTLTGMYTYMADAAVFEDCATGKRYPVLIEMEHIEVERGYLELRESPGKPLLLTGRFAIVERPPEPGMPPREHLRVLEFGEFTPGEGCPR